MLFAASAPLHGAPEQACLTASAMAPAMHEKASGPGDRADTPPAPAPQSSQGSQPAWGVNQAQWNPHLPGSAVVA